MTSKVRRVIFSPRAESDLREAWSHLAQRDVRAADRFYDAMSARAESLCILPERGSLHEEFGRGIRMLIEGRYLILYRIELHEVWIARVLHGSRDITKLFT